MKAKKKKIDEENIEKKVIIRIKTDKWRKFRSLAFKNETSMNKLINTLIDKALSKKR